MKLAPLVCSLVVTVAASAAARAEPPDGRTFGIGVLVPEPAAFTVEAYLTRATAIDAAVGWDTFGDKNGYGHFDYLVYPVDLARGGVLSVPLSIGLGLWLRDVHGDVDFGARVPVGIALNFREAPLQLFGELAVRVILASANDPEHIVDLDGAVGFRLFF